jgi:hypothetical protein
LYIAPSQKMWHGESRWVTVLPWNVDRAVVVRGRRAIAVGAEGEPPADLTIEQANG